MTDSRSALALDVPRGRLAPSPPRLAVPRWFRWLRGLLRMLSSDRARFYVLLDRHASVLDRSVAALGAALADEPARATELAALEVERERLVIEMEDALLATIVTPIDREDLQRLSSELAAFADLAGRAARVFAGRPSRPAPAAFEGLISTLVVTTGHIVGAVGMLRADDYASAAHASREVRRLRLRARALYREGVGSLTDRESALGDATLVAEIDVLAVLDASVAQGAVVARALAHVAWKHA